MKRISFHILIGFIVFLFLTGCGDNSSILEKPEATSLKISITKTKENKLFSKQNLDIGYMRVEVYLAFSAVDKSYLDKTPIQVEPFSKVLNDWKVSLSGLDKNENYIFVVTAFSTETVEIDKLIFKGLKNQKIVESANEIKINLTQTSNANTVQNLPSASNIVVTKLANDSIELSFTLSNPYEEALNWEIQNDGTGVVSTDFSTNSAQTNALTTAININYLETNSNNYLLLLSTDDAVVSYHFSITMEDDSVDVSVETAPLIKKLLVSVVGTELSLKPELDKIASTYAWEIVENLGSAISIDNSSLQNITLSEYTETSEFKIKLTVSSTSGAFSYRIYHILGNNSGSTDVVIPPISVDTGNIKKTQQTVSYDALGDVSTNVKDDGYYKKGITPSYTKNPTTKIVTDNVTSLMWQDDNDPSLDWNHADTYCTDSIIGSFTDWRLPSPSELDTLKTYYLLDPVSSTHDVLLDGIFEPRSTFKYWTSFKYAISQTSDLAWGIDFKTGNQGDARLNRIYPYLVRCVRGTFIQPTFTKDISTGIVTDSLNNLEWQDNGVFVAELWQDAMDRCEELTLGEVGNDKGWRLPNVNELNSLVDRSKNPRMYSTFTSHPSFGNSYWSSTAYFNSKSFAYVVGVSFGSSGTVSHSSKTIQYSSLYSRCVRDISLSGE